MVLGAMDTKKTAELLRLVLDPMRTLSIGLVGQDRFATHADDLLLIAAVFIGQSEGKPMTAAKLAEYVGLPRPTAIRKLKRFQVRGTVKRIDRGRFVLASGVMDTHKAMRALDAASKRVVK